MEDQSKEIEEKQQFLKGEILNQGYNAEKFSEYISNLKENGTDLNNWTLEELQNIVVSFKNQENSGEINSEEIIEEVENVKNSFILSKNDVNNSVNNNQNNPYDKIFDEKEEIFKGVENIMSDLNKEEDKKKNQLWSEMGDFEIIDPSEFVDSSKDIIKCEKSKENSLTKYDNLTVNIIG